MIKRWLLPGFATMLFASLPTSAAIKGEYIEARSADVYTGPCFANSEVGLAGQEAIMAWRIQDGDWNGINLSGLSVVAVVRANATLGDPYHTPYPARSVLIVDSHANPAQRRALAEFAASKAGSLLDHVVRVESAPIAMSISEDEHHASSQLVAGGLARIETRSLCQGDHLCGNESVYYSPLVPLTHSMPAFTLVSSFSGQGLGEVWKNIDKRSAFVGTF